MNLSTDRPKRRALLTGIVLLLMIGLIALTRFTTLGHNMYLHPDEPVFFESSTSILNADNGYAYTPVKSYPEGAFLLFMPFQLLGDLLGKAMGVTFEARVIGRVASVLFFMLGCILGGLTLLRGFPKQKFSIPVYALTMVFSLFQIEQSRYGTGDPMSFFLLMAAIYLLMLYLRDRTWFCLYLSSFVIGILGAVKYPQLYFLLLPLCAIRLGSKGLHTSRVKLYALVLLSTLVGFLLFSPSILTKKGFFAELCTREMTAWSDEAGGAASPLWHLVSLIIYQCLYSDFPFALPFAVYAVIVLWREKREDGAVQCFFAQILPVVLGLFFIYNLFVRGLAFRTYYIYFSITALYTAYGIGRLCGKVWWRPVLAVLACFMIVRGSLFTITLANDHETVTDKLSQHEMWVNDEMTIAAVDFCPGGVPFNARSYQPEEFLSQGIALDWGEFAMVTAFDHHWSDTRLFSMLTGQGPTETVKEWKRFKEENEPYQFDVMYPDSDSALYGFWVYGSTLGNFEFPQIYFYCCEV